MTANQPTITRAETPPAVIRSSLWSSRRALHPRLATRRLVAVPAILAQFEQYRSQK